jgi:hypothetical protein
MCWWKKKCQMSLYLHGAHGIYLNKYSSQFTHLCDITTLPDECHLAETVTTRMTHIELNNVFTA